MGVDIWSRLYQNQFTQTFAFDSYSSLDLDSVDSGILSTLYPLLGKQNDWDFIICSQNLLIPLILILVIFLFRSFFGG